MAPSSAIRSLQAITSPGVGGRELVAPALARELIRSGHPSWVLCRRDTVVAERSRDWNVPVVPTAMQGYFSPGAVWALRAFLRRERIAIVHAHWSRDLSNLLLAARAAGHLPLVLTKHVYSTARKRDPFHDLLYRRVAAVIAVSRLVAENLADTTATPRDRIWTIYPGVDTTERWDPARWAEADLRAEFGVPPRAPVLGFAGRWNEGKGPHLLLAAFRRLAAEHPAWHLVLVGRAVGGAEEQYAAGLLEAVRRDGLEARVHFIPYREDMPAVLRTFEIAVCPSAFESFGLVAVEAMAMERPVVATAAGGFTEIVLPGGTGELFRPGSESDLAAKLAPLLGDAGRRAILGRAGRRRAVEEFSWDRSAARILECYRRVLGERTGRTGTGA